MILSYSNWKSLTESDKSTVALRVTCELKETYDSNTSSDENSEAVKERIIRLFPNSTETKNNSIIISQDKFENLEGETEPLILNIPPAIYISPELKYPLFIWRWFNLNSKENFSNKNNRINCLLKDEFLNYSSDELVNRISQDLLKEYGISDDAILDAVEHIMLSKSLGEIGGNVSELSKDLVNKMAADFSLNYTLDVFKEQTLNLTQINSNTIESQLNTKVNGLLIDYSKLSDADLEKVVMDLSNALDFLSDLVHSFGKEIANISLKYSDMLLDHLDNYPEVLTMIAELKNKK